MTHHPLITDLAEVRRRAKTSEDVDLAFRRLLKDSGLDERDVDAAVHRSHAEVAARIDCRSCANCCRELAPALDRRDIERLARAAGLAPAGLVREYLRNTDEPGRFILRTR